VIAGAGAGAVAHWVAALFLALAFMLLVYLVLLVSRQSRDLADLRRRLDGGEQKPVEAGEAASAGVTETSGRRGGTAVAQPGPDRRWSAASSGAEDRVAESSFYAHSNPRESQRPGPLPPPPPPPPALEAKAARQPQQETGRALVAHYNRLVEDISREMIEQFKARWQPVAMVGTSPETLTANEAGELWVVKAADDAGLAYHYVLPGEKLFVKWSTMKGDGGHGIKDYLGRFYAIEEGVALRLDRAAAVYEEGGRYLPLALGRLYGV
jgi:hypothetical protein